MHRHSFFRPTTKLHGYSWFLAGDFIGVAVLISLTCWQITSVFVNLDISFITSIFIVMSSAINVIGLIVAVAYQRAVFTTTFFFTLIFFSLAPAQQMIYHLDPLMADPSIILRAFGFCLIFSTICLAALFAIGPTLPPIANSLGRMALPQAFSGSACTLLFVLLCLGLSVGFIWFGRGLLTDRTTYSEILQDENSQPILLLYGGALRPFTVYGSIVGLWAAWSHGKLGWCSAFIATLSGGLLLSNPLIGARFEVATLFYAIIFYFSGRRHNRFLVVALFLGVAIAPLFNLFRSGDIPLEYATFDSLLVSMDFDAFSLLCHTIWHVDYHGLDFGKNIISAVFFFVPRAFWISKNEPTPFYLLDSLRTFRGLWSPNLSEPLIAEGYFAFGVLGVFAITITYIWFVWFLERNAGDNHLSVLYLFCCAAPPLLFILLRGTLIVGVSVITGHLLAMYLAVKIITLRFKARKVRYNSLYSQIR